MQNLSLPVKQSSTVKSLEEPAKVNTNSNKLAQNSANGQDNMDARNAFQNMLNKQVQAKRMQENAALSKPNKPTVKNSEASNADGNVQKNNLEKNLKDALKDANKDKINTRVDTATNAATTLNAQSGTQAQGAAVDTMNDEENQRKMTEDAAILASLMQELTNASPQAVIDPTVLKVNAQGVLNGTAISQKAEDNIASGLDNGNQSLLTKDALITTESYQHSENALQHGEAFSGAQQPWKDALASKMQSLETSSETESESPLLASDLLKSQDFKSDGLKNNPLEANALTAVSHQNGSLKDAVSKMMAEKDRGSNDLTGVNALQNSQSTHATLNNPALATTQLASSNYIQPSPGKSGWDQAISQKVMWMVGAGEQSATLTLNPPDLGPLQVVINVHNDQADTTFISDNADVRQALQDGLEHLREKMEASGLQLGQANINAGQQSQQSFQETAQRQLMGQTTPQNTASVNEPVTRAITREINGLVDTFA